MTFFFQIALPSCGIHFENPHMNYISSIDEIPPAMITFLMGPGISNIIFLNCSRGNPFSFPSLLLKVILTVLMPRMQSYLIFYFILIFVFTVLPWVKTSLSSLIESSTIIFYLSDSGNYCMISKLLDNMIWPTHVRKCLAF